MSLSREIHRRCELIPLVLTLVLIATSCLLSAQTAPPPKAPSAGSDVPPKAELFVGYQFLNPGGNIPDQNTPPNAFKLPSIVEGVGASLAWNFTKYWALEGDYGGNWNRHAAIDTGAIGPKLTFRGDQINVFVHTLFGI